MTQKYPQHGVVVRLSLRHKAEQFAMPRDGYQDFEQYGSHAKAAALLVDNEGHFRRLAISPKAVPADGQ